MWVGDDEGFVEGATVGNAVGGDVGASLGASGKHASGSKFTQPL